MEMEPEPEVPMEVPMEISMDSLLFVLTASFLCGYVIFMVLNMISLAYAWRWLYSYPVPDYPLPSQGDDLPGVSIIKPLIGFDLNMKQNLESFFQLQYPNFELIFCIAEAENKPVLGVLKELRTQYPHIHVSLYQGAKVIGVNPKINNMLPGYKNAQYEFVWISDCSIKTPPFALLEMIRHMADPKTALVHQLPFVDVVEDYPGYLEKVYFGTQHARVYILAAWVGSNCANGMSWLLRKKALEQEGGMEAFTDYLAEDFFMSKAMWTRGWKFVLSTLPARQNPSKRSLTGYQARTIRWGRLRTTMMPWPGLVEPLTESVCLGIISSLCVYSLFDISPLLFMALHLFFWFVYDILLIRVVECGALGSPWYVLLAWCLREIWTFPLFIAGLGNRVEWGGQKYRIQLGGKTFKLD